MTITSVGISRSEAYEFLEGFGLSAGAVADPEVRSYGRDAFHGFQEARANWATKRLELNGKFASRQSAEGFGQSMTVTSVISSEGLLVTDDRGGSRTEAYREFPVATCMSTFERFGCDGVVSFDLARDGYGTIVEFVRDKQGLPSAVRFGEVLLLRYSFTPPLPEGPKIGRLSDRWRPPSSWELIDLRTSEIVLDSTDVAKVAAERPVLAVHFQGMGEVLRFEGESTFAVVQSRHGWPYALLPLDVESEVWRTVYASGDMSGDYHFRVDYTDDLVRTEISAGQFRGRSVVVEAPRNRESTAVVSVVHPGPDRLTNAMRSGVRLRTAESLEAWLHSTFEKESLPIVLRPLHTKGVEAGSGVLREAGRTGSGLQFGPADGCEEQGEGIVCRGGSSEVIGEESSAPW